MSEPVSLAPQVQDGRGVHAGDSVVVPLKETIAPQTGSSPPDAAAPVAVAPRPRGGRWFPAFCAVLALLAAGVALAAPTLRPLLAASADAWLGKQNVVSQLLVPPAEINVAWRRARDETMQALNAHLTDYDARIERMSAAQQSAAARAAADLKADHAANEALARSVDDLARQTRQMQAATAAVDQRVRAAGLLTLSLRLRRDVDAGLPIDRDVSALDAGGPYPPQIERALQQLRKLSDGTPTMRDLADELDRVLVRLAARSDSGASWTSRSWTRVEALFGGGTPAGEDRLVQRLRALAVDGRFSEAADEIASSGQAELGGAWVAQVRARATAVVATQLLLTYSLAAYENAVAAHALEGG